MIAYKKRTMHL